MNVYTGVHAYYCGIDLHARTMYVCVLDKEGKKVYHKNIPCRPDRLLQAIEPFRVDIVVGVECIFCWYWLADLCEEEGIDFVLGHALYMKAIHGVEGHEYSPPKSISIPHPGVNSIPQSGSLVFPTFAGGESP